VRPPRLLSLLSFLAPSALVACGLTADFSGIQGGALDASAPLPIADAGAPAPLDASSSPPPVDAGDAGFCASLSLPPRLCADFDEGQPVDTGWTLLDVSPNATVKVDTIGFSGSGSMLSAITPADVPGVARLHEAVPLLTTQLHVELEMLLPTGGGPFELCAIHETAPDGTDYGLFYKEEKGALVLYIAALEDDGGLAQFVYPLGNPPSSWLHVSIDFTIGDQGSIVLKHDGAVVVDAGGIPTATAGATQLFVALGFYSPNAATAQADFDDVVVDWP
jgi:hypothetical protein